MQGRTARCCCGGLRVACKDEAVRVSICHCLECQKRTGAVFSTNARFAKESVNVSGPSNSYSRKGDSGNDVAFHFCPACGSTVYWTLGGFPEFVAVAVGCFADPGFVAPRVSVYEARAHHWVRRPECVTEHHE